MSGMDNAISALVTEANNEDANAPAPTETSDVPATVPDAPAVPETEVTDTPAPKDDTPPADDVIAPPDAPAAPPAPPADDDDFSNNDTPAPVEAPDFTLDVEDANGVTYKINGIEDLPEDFEPANNRQIIEILSNLGRLESERNAYEADQQADQEAEARQAEIDTIQTSWNDEIKSLQGDKRLPVLADGSVPPKVDEVFKYMQEENAKRIEAGRPTIRSFEDALDKLENKEFREAQNAKPNKDEARKNGALVGGNSSPSGPPAQAYKAGSAKNIQEAIRQANLL